MPGLSWRRRGLPASGTAAAHACQPSALGKDGGEILMVRDDLQARDGDRMRASDRDREATVAVLREAYVAGRLNLSELRDRAGAAYAASTWDDLRELTADLLGGLVEASGREHVGIEAYHGIRACADGQRRRPFAPMLIMALVWLAIAAAAPMPAAAIPLVGLALFAMWAAWWKPR
jgi:hypothetical protein